MKKIFSIITLICITLSAVVVGLDFFSNLESTSVIYNEIYNYTTNSNNNSLKADIEKSNILSLQVLNSQLNTEQKEYLTIMLTTINKLDEFCCDLALALVKDDSETSASNSALDKTKKLTDARNNLLFELNVYNTKMSGNTIGDAFGTHQLLIKDILEFINIYNEAFYSIHSLVNKSFIETTKYNLYELYYNSILNVVKNYNSNNLSFNSNSLTTLKFFNRYLSLENNIIKTYVDGGVWSNIAYNFNKNYTSINSLEFVKNYYLKSFNSINILTETNSYTLTYYYLYILLGVE